MHFEAAKISPLNAYKLLISTVIPRPIALVTTVDTAGHRNAAPFSFFNAMGSKPPVVVLGFEPGAEGSQKDTPRNILATGEFVINIVDEAMATRMNQCAANLPSDVDELELSGFDTIQSQEISPPRIVVSPVSMECRLFESVPLEGGGHIVVGEVLHFHVRDDVVVSLDPLRIDIDRLAPIARLNGPRYARITDQFALRRPESK